MGRLRLEGSLFKLCKLVYRLDDSLGQGAALLERIRREALERGAAVLACPEPLCPGRLEAVLLPERELGFVSGDWEAEGAELIGAGAFIPKERRAQVRAELRQRRRLERQLTEPALELLRGAKALHDRLEQVYRPYMDFPALDGYVQGELLRLFGD